MSKGAYIGVNDVARKMKGGYIGVNDVARKVKKAYVGDASGKARLWWEPEPGYLTFSSPSTFTISVANPCWDGTMQYSIGANTWVTWDGSAISGTKVYIRGTGNTAVSGGGTDFCWTLTGSNIACTGNIETLLDYATVKAGGHPTMATRCYSYMFYGCTSLTTAPELPATTLADYCYTSMFFGCAALTTAPALPATTLAEGCYSYMFYGCTRLTTAPALPATTLANGCYTGMFQACGALTTAPALPATTLATVCYYYMFQGCAKLKKIPKLPATTLAMGCYNNMFNGCTSVILSVKADVLINNKYYNAYKIPYSGTGTTATDALTDMFAYTGGDFTGTPTINTIYGLREDCGVV